MNVSEIMTRKVVNISIDYTLKTIRQIFYENNFHHLLVIKNGKLAGVISDRDLFKALNPFVHGTSEPDEEISKDILNKKAFNIMSSDITTVKETTSLGKVMQHFVSKNFSCLPVIADEGEVVGIVTLKDIVKHYLRKELNDQQNRAVRRANRRLD